MKCHSCQADNEDGAATCGSCGVPLWLLKKGAVVAGRYEIGAPLGKGGMGVVYEAYDRILDELVALKVLPPGFATTPELAHRFRSEIKLARKVSHRNVCRIHEYGEDGGLRYLSMELVEGVNLKQAVRDVGALPEPEAFDVAIQLCKGLQAIHDVGIIHRDLKTANIMKDNRGIVRLMDFGIAKLWGDDQPDGVTGAGAIIGTPEYMSPEQARSQKLDFGSDLYSLGVVVFELYTGRLPFHGDTPLDTLVKHVLEQPPLDDVPGYVAPVLRKCLAKYPAERYATARGVAADLRQGRPVPGQVATPKTVAGPLVPEVDLTPLPAPQDETPLPQKTAVAGSRREFPAQVDEAIRSKVLDLVPGLKDPNVQVRWRTAVAFCQLGPAAREALIALIDASTDPEPSVADAAAEAVKRITGQTPTRALRPIPAPGPLPPRTIAPDVDSFTRALREGDGFARWRAALAIGAAGPEAADAVPALVEALDDEAENVRWASAAALGKIGPAASRAVPALAGALGDRSDEVLRRHAAQALGGIGAEAKDAVPGLIAALRGDAALVGEAVVDALVEIGAPAVPALLEALKDEDGAVRFHAADALTKIGIGYRPVHS